MSNMNRWISIAGVIIVTATFGGCSESDGLGACEIEFAVSPAAEGVRKVVLHDGEGAPVETRDPEPFMRFDTCPRNAMVTVVRRTEQGANWLTSYMRADRGVRVGSTIAATGEIANILVTDENLPAEAGGVGVYSACIADYVSAPPRTLTPTYLGCPSDDGSTGDVLAVAFQGSSTPYAFSWAKDIPLPAPQVVSTEPWVVGRSIEVTGTAQDDDVLLLGQYRGGRLVFEGGVRWRLKENLRGAPTEFADEEHVRLKRQEYYQLEGVNTERSVAVRHGTGDAFEVDDSLLPPEIDSAWVDFNGNQGSVDMMLEEGESVKGFTFTSMAVWFSTIGNGNGLWQVYGPPLSSGTMVFPAMPPSLREFQGEVDVFQLSHVELEGMSYGEFRESGMNQYEATGHQPRPGGRARSSALLF